jgi:hypothetical protein
MTKTLARACLDCGKPVRGKTRCRDCATTHDRAKRARRPDLDDHHERERRRRLVADHRAEVGDWCPGIEDHPAHPLPTWWPTTWWRWPSADSPPARYVSCAAKRTADVAPESMRAPSHITPRQPKSTSDSLTARRSHETRPEGPH